MCVLSNLLVVSVFVAVAWLELFQDFFTASLMFLSGSHSLINIQLVGNNELQSRNCPVCCLLRS
jgi:hypothetical protein